MALSNNKRRVLDEDENGNEDRKQKQNKEKI